MSEYAEDLRKVISSLLPDPGATSSPEAAMDMHRQLAELGLTRIGIDESVGGSGGTLDDLLVVVDAVAGQGAGTPLIEASVADWVLGHQGSLGDALCTVRLLDDVQARLAGTDDGLRVTAELPAVPWGRYADRLLISSEATGTLLIDLKHSSVSSLTRQNVAGEPYDTVLLRETPAVRIAGSPSHAAVRERLALVWSAAVAGAAHGTYLLTKQYVSEREQFGAPLLRIPAVSSGLATMKVQLLQAAASLRPALQAVASGTNSSSAAAVAVARLTTAKAATEIAHLAHQLHGAMGITQEYSLQHYTRRLWSWRDAVASEREWAELLGRHAAQAGEEAVWADLTAVTA